MTRFIRLAWKELWNRRWSILAYTVVDVLFLLMYVSIYPSVSKEAARFDELVRSYPKALLEAFNIEQLKLNTLQGYIAVEHFSFIWPLMAILLALSLSVGSVAGEIESGTMAMLLSLPLSRFKLFAAKYLAVLKGMVFFVVCSTLLLWPIAKAFNYTVPVSALLSTMAICLLFTWALVGLGFLVASFVSQKGYAYMVLGGGLLVMYVFNIVSGLVKSLEGLKYASLFYYFAPGNILMGRKLELQPVAVFVAVAVVASVLALWRLTRRDIVVQ